MDAGKIRKLQVWRTKSPLLSRWDLEATFDDKTQRRVINVSGNEVEALVRGMFGRSAPNDTTILGGYSMYHWLHGDFPDIEGLKKAVKAKAAVGRKKA